MITKWTGGSQASANIIFAKFVWNHFFRKMWEVIMLYVYVPQVWEYSCPPKLQMILIVILIFSYCDCDFGKNLVNDCDCDWKSYWNLAWFMILILKSLGMILCNHCDGGTYGMTDIVTLFKVHTSERTPTTRVCNSGQTQ